MTTTRGQSNLGSARPMSRVEWAIARYNYYRAFGLLDDPQPQITSSQRPPDPQPKPHLKWYPLSKEDDHVATTYRRSVQVTPSAPGRRYCQRVDHARARAMIARYQAEQDEAAKGVGPPPQFVEADHNRFPKGDSRGGQFAPKGSVSQPTQGEHSPDSTDTQQPSSAEAERFSKILCRLKTLHPNEYAFFEAIRGSLADDGKTWANWDQPLTWGDDRSVRIRSGAKSDFEILRFIVNSISRAPNYKRWRDAQIKSGAIKPPPEPPPELWSRNSTQAKAQREQQYQYMALAGATPNEIAMLQNDVLRYEWFGQGGYVENGVMLAGSVTSAFNIKAGGTGGPLTFKSKPNQSAAARKPAPSPNRPPNQLEFKHQLKVDKETDIAELNRQIRRQVAQMNKIIEKEGMQGLKQRIRDYRKNVGPGRVHVKTLDDPGEGSAWLHEPDMRTGGGPKDVTGTGDKRVNSIIGGQASRLADDILEMPDSTTRIDPKITIIPSK